MYYTGIRWQKIRIFNWLYVNRARVTYQTETKRERGRQKRKKLKYSILI